MPNFLKKMKEGLANPASALIGFDTKKLVDDAQKSYESQNKYNEKFLEVLTEIDKKQDELLKKIQELGVKK